MKAELDLTESSAIDRTVRRLSSATPFVLVFIPLLVIYLATANLATHNHIDPLTNAMTGWHLGMTGSVVMPEHGEAATDEQYGNVAWIVESPRGPISQYPPGAAALAAPLYRLSGATMTDWYVEGFNNPDSGSILFPLPSAAPAKIAAAVATAAAMGFVAAAIPHAGGTRLAAVAAGYVGGLGTTMWSTASDALWQHGPASMWLALGIYLAARSRLWWAGMAFGAAVMTRPPTALVAAAIGLTIAIAQRKILPVVKVGAGSVAGLAGLLWYNWWVWGELSITGGYGSGFVDQVASTDSLSYLENVVGALVDPTYGLLLYSPFLLVLIPGIRAGWQRLPDWARGAAIGGAVYLLVQLKANRFSGGAGFLGYRYPLEALTSAGVLLTFSYVHWVSERPFLRRIFWGSVLAALIPQVVWKVRFVPPRG